MPRPKKVKTLATELATQTSNSKYNFFTEADYNQRGEVASMIPSWSCTQMLEDLLTDIEGLEMGLKDGSVQPEHRAKMEQQLQERKERYDMASKKPKMDSDKLYKLCGKDHQSGELGEKIAESMFSHDDMRRGIADASLELKRMTEPCIKLSPEEADIASGCNVRIDGDRKVNRDDAIKVWKFCRLYLGEMSNPEVLRR